MKNTMNWKKVLALMLALSLLLAVVGCNSNMPPSTENESSTGVTQEEIDALKEENSRLQAELDALRETSESEERPDEEESDATEALEADATDTGIISDEETSAPASQASTPSAVTAITFSKSTDLTLNVGDTNRRSATTTPIGGAVSYSSSNIAVATVDATGNVICKSVGKTLISAVSGGATTSYNLTVVATTSPSTSASSIPENSNAVSKSGYLVNYTVTVNDKTTLAASSGGKDYPITTYYFYSSKGNVLGSLTGATYKSILESYKGPLPDNDWGVWLTEQFNLYRGLGNGNAAGGTSGSNIGSFTSSVDDVDTEAFRQDVISLSNSERENAGMPPLSADSDAMAYAQIRAEELSSSYSHTRPNDAGKKYGSYTFVEIIYKGPTTPQKAVSGWMNSSGHKSTLLANYSDYGNKTGVGCYQDSDGILYWVQVFVIWDADA